MRTPPFSEVELFRTRRNATEDLVLFRVRWTPSGDEFLQVQSFLRNTTGPGTPTRDKICVLPKVWAALLPALQAAVDAAAPPAEDPEGAESE